MKRLQLIPLLAILSCKGDSNDSGATGASETDSCGDIDGSGGDTGDVPNVLGNWTATFGTYSYDDNECEVKGLEQTDMSWLNGSLLIDGRVPQPLVATLVGDDEYWGVINSHGGIVFTGTHMEGEHTLYVTFGGLLYDVPAVERKEIRGFGYIGVDLGSTDQVIDCWIQGDFTAKKSGN